MGWVASGDRALQKLRRKIMKSETEIQEAIEQLTGIGATAIEKGDPLIPIVVAASVDLLKWVSGNPNNFEDAMKKLREMDAMAKAKPDPKIDNAFRQGWGDA
jgi:hypothetical protein